MSAEGIARLRTSIDSWEGGNPAPEFAKELIADILAMRDGDRAIGCLVSALARTVLQIWRAYESPGPMLAAIESMEGWLNGGKSREACRQFASPARTSYIDCTAASLECAAEAVAAAARFVADHDPEEALAAMGWTCEALNQSGGGTEAFLLWLADQALPTALEGRVPAPFLRSSATP